MGESSKQQLVHTGNRPFGFGGLTDWALVKWNSEQAAVVAYDPSARILDWQHKLAAPDQSKDPNAVEGVEPSSVTHLVRQTCEFFRDLVRLIQRRGSLPSEIRNGVRGSYETLMLWDDAYKVSDGGLDSVFALSSTVRTLTCKSIRRIAEQVTKGLALLPGAGSLTHSAAVLQDASDQIARSEAHEYAFGYSDDDSSVSTDIPGWRSASEVSKNLVAHAECLMGMDSLYENPPPDPKPNNTTMRSIGVKSTGDDQASSAVDAGWKDWSADQIYRDRISQRFPCAQESLVARLGQTNLSRYLRCKNKRDRGDAHPATDAAAGAAAANITALPSKWKDSGVGTSLGPQSSDHIFAKYAKTVMSYGQGNEKTTRIPSISDEARKGEPFECFICGKQVVAINDVAWKQHLLSDLQPYICLEVSCQQSEVFETRDSWVSHLGSEHYLAWAGAPCPLCGEQMKDGLVAITDHLRYHLEELALACGPSIVGSDSGQESEEEQEPKRKSEHTRERVRPTLMSCPYRKRNPKRFNVRDHEGCATYGFESIDLLKRHVREHHRSHSDKNVCGRCHLQFSTGHELEKHVSQETSCKIAPLLANRNPEDGIDDNVFHVFIYVERDVKINTWVKLWQLLFPNDALVQVPDPEFVPVVESFEL
ncbi:hypothetical protein RB595_002883 [Gaeumannomyces hyphopodioides]